jgi:4-hydroxybenzoate polyprenyltransferase
VHIALLALWLCLAVILQIVGWGGAIVPLALLGVALELGFWLRVIYLKRQRRFATTERRAEATSRQ